MDPVSPEVKIAPKEALQFGSETVTGPTITPEALARLKELRDIREKSTQGKDVLNRAAEFGKEVRFSSAEAHATKLQFGGGKAKENPGPPPTAEIDPSEPVLERSSFENAKKAIDEANSFIQYTSIQSEHERTGKTINAIISERVARGEDAINNPTSYNRARESSLDAIFASSAAQQLFPELGTIAETARRTYIESTLAKDPFMRNQVAKALKEVAVETQNLQEVDSDADYKKAKEDLDVDKPKRDAAKDDVVNAIKADIKNGPPLTPAQEDAIKKMIDDGNPPETIIRYARGLVLNSTNIDKFDSLNEIVNKQNELAQRSQMLATTTKAPERASLQAEVANLQTEIRNLTTSNTVTNNELHDFSDLLIRYTDQKDAGSVYVSSIAQRASEGSQLSKSIKENEDLIKRKGTDSLKKEGRSRNNRLMKEAELQDRLDNIFSDAVIATLNDRYDKMVILEQQRLNEEAKKTGTDDDKAVLKGMENNWIRFDKTSRQKLVDQNRIRQDMRLLAYEGDDGIKRLMLRELGLKIQKLDAGAPLFDHAGNPVMEALDHNNVDLSTLSDEHKKRLDEVFAKHGNNFRDKLFKDSFAARTLTSRLKDGVPFTDKMGLKSHEWQMLEEHYSGKLGEALGKSKEAQSILKSLEAQGIKPEFRRSWMLYILMTLGLIAVAPFAVGAVGAVGAAGGIAKDVI